MGLDMYLYAKRSFAANSPEVPGILAAAGMTLDDLKAHCAPDEDGYSDYLYLPRYAYGDRAEDIARKERSDAIFEAAGLLSLTHDDDGGGLRAEGDKVVAHVTCLYWRKSNAIHGWFVDNVQGGTDDCGEYLAHPEHLAQLRALCQTELDRYAEGKAGAILTPRSGFFFGGTEIDDWYAQDLQRTVDGLERAIKAAIEVGGVDFYYHSSW